MALMPKRVKHRKSQRGRIKGNATRGNKVVFGDFGLQALEGGWIKAQTIEAGSYCGAAVCAWRRSFVCADYSRIRSITSTPLETRMGKGKGEPEHWVATVQTWHGFVRVERGHRGAGTRLFCSLGAQDAHPGAIPAAASGLSGEWITRFDHPFRAGWGKAAMKTDELCDMSDEQLTLTLNDTVENLFRLRMQAQTERLDAPSELRRHRRLVARIKTIQRQRELALSGRQTSKKKKRASRLCLRKLRWESSRETRWPKRDGSKSSGWSSTPSTVSMCGRPLSVMCMTRMKSRARATWWKSSSAHPVRK
jgi:large subunit ribosomal protein L16